METNLPISAKYLGNQLWIDEDGIIWTGRNGAYLELFGGDLFVTTNTDVAYYIFNLHPDRDVRILVK